MARYRTGQEPHLDDVVEIDSGTRDGRSRRRRFVVVAVNGDAVDLFDREKKRHARDVPIEEIILVTPASAG